MPVEVDLPIRPKIDSIKFSKEFPQGKVKSIASQDIPTAAMDLFDSRLGLRTMNHINGKFDSFYRVEHDSGDATYIAQKTVKNENGSTFDWTYFFDTNSHGGMQGYGEMARGNSGKPFVGYTFSEEKRKGFGKRRVEMMNGMAQMLYDVPLHSGVTIADAARSIWDSLVDEGLAESYMDGDSKRYAFI